MNRAALHRADAPAVHSEPSRSRPSRVPGSVLAGVSVIALVMLGTTPAALAEPQPDEVEPPEHAYSAQGQEVDGGASLAQAAPVEPGIHRDSFAAGGAESDVDGTVKYYRVAVEDGQRVHAAATIAAPPYAEGLPEEAEGLSVDVSFLTATGDTCDDEIDEDLGESWTGDGPITTAAISDLLGPDACAGDELFVRVAREGPRDVEVPLPVEIQIAIQPPGIGGGEPVVQEEIEDRGATPTAPKSSEPLALGRSFAAATEVDPGSYVIEMVPGETGLIAIDVQEGQRLRWRLETTSQPEESSGELSLLAFDAARELVTVQGKNMSLTGSTTVYGGGMAAPVDLGNRSSDLPSVRSAWLPGTHTIQLHHLQAAADVDPSSAGPVTFILTLEVEGEVAEDAAEGTVLELGDTTASSRGGLLDPETTTGRILLYAGAGGLGLLALVLGVTGVLVLRLRRG